MAKIKRYLDLLSTILKSWRRAPEQALLLQPPNFKSSSGGAAASTISYSYDWSSAVEDLHASYSLEVLQDLRDSVRGRMGDQPKSPTNNLRKYAEYRSEDILVLGLLNAALGGSAGYPTILRIVDMRRAPAGLWQALFTTEPTDLPRIAVSKEYCSAVQEIAACRLRGVSVAAAPSATDR